MRAKRILALVLGITLVSAACGNGDDGDDNAAPGSTGSPGSPTAPEGDPIVLGVIGSFTGSQSASLGLSDEGAQVWADAVNDAGGVNGHPVELIIKDDALDPAKALQAAKELVEEENVMAIIANNSLVDAAWAEYVDSKGVPVIGGNPTQTTFFTDANFYPTGTNVVALIFAQFVRMKEAGLSKMGLLYCAEAPLCAQLTGLAQAAAALVGDVTLAANASVSATQPSYNAECVAMKNAGVDALFVAHGAAQVVTITEGCAKVGFDPTDVNQATIVSSQWLSTASLQSALLTSPNVAHTDGSAPGIKEFLDAVEQYNPDMIDSPQFTQNVLWSWLSGKMFEKVATAADLGPTSTPADVKTGLHMIENETLGGAIPPITYTEGKPTQVNCWFDVDLEAGDLKTVDTEPVCPTPEQLEGLKGLLGGGS